MRYLVGFGLALALVAFPMSVNAQGAEGASKQASAASFVHGGGLLPPQLMLRVSYYLYLDADADTGATSDQTEPNAEEPKSAQADGEVATSESNLEEPVSSPAPGTEVPDIDILSRRSIEHFEIQSEEKKKRERTRGRARRKGIPIAVAAVVAVVVLGAVGASYSSSGFD